MSQSQSLRARDVQAIYQLVNECRDLGLDAREWYQHLADRLRSLLALRACVVAESWKPSTEQRVSAPFQVASGLDSEVEAMFRRYVESAARDRVGRRRERRSGAARCSIDRPGRSP